MFGYPHNELEPVSFQARLIQRHDGKLHGTAEETGILGHTVYTRLHGINNGYSIRVDKTYHLLRGQFLTATYVGEADKKHERIAGSWYLLHAGDVLWSGPFAMERAKEVSSIRQKYYPQQHAL